MSRRTTRSSASLNRDPTSIIPTPLTTANPPDPTLEPPPTRKRKAADPPLPPIPRATRSKRARGSNATLSSSSPEAGRTKKSKRAPAADMSSAAKVDNSADSGDTSPQQQPATKRKSSRKTKEGASTTLGGERTPAHTDPSADPASSASASGSRRSKRGLKKGQDVPMKDANEKDADPAAEQEEDDARPSTGGGADASNEPPRRYTDDELDALDRDDPFTSAYLGRFAGHGGLSGSLRALSGLMSGTHGRLRTILEQLRMKEDPSIQLIALQELSELLLVSNEDNLAGHFAPDQFVKELVALMQPNEFTAEENPEMMLLACRCIANMMEALPASTASVVYGGAVPILCQKLLEIHFIDLAEQSLSTLEKISVEFPASIVREGGLTACLTYLDFFATSTQRTAVTTAANCCRNIPEDSFPVVRDVMPILLTTLASNDQRVVEQASLCVSRVIDSFKYHESKLEELVSPDLLRAILRLLLPGSTNMIGPGIHTQFLKSLSITARASSRLSVELLKMNVVDTLYQIMTGVSPPSGIDDAASQIDKNIIMQAIIRTPRERIFETLNVVCEILPSISHTNLTFLDDLCDASSTEKVSMSTRSKKSPNDKRVDLLKDCPAEVKRFAVILFPTLMHAYTSTVNLSVRQKVLTAQLKMLSNFKVDILEEALRGVTYASHLASILSQQENPSLVTFALQAAELLLKRLEAVYRPQFYREGVIAEIDRLAQRPLKSEAPTNSTTAGDQAKDVVLQAGNRNNKLSERDDVEPNVLDVDMDHESDGDEVQDQENETEENEEQPEEEEDDDDEDDEGDEDQSDGPELLDPHGHGRIVDQQDIITLRAKKFMEVHGDDGDEAMRAKATSVLDDLRALALELKTCYCGVHSQEGIGLFRRMAGYFAGDALESITSYELMTSGIVDILLSVFNDPDDQAAREARSDFLEVFMSDSARPTGGARSQGTPISVLILKLQDLLSRAEHFEVITVHQNAHESNRGSAASMLAKQLRLKLVADEESGIPRHFRSIMVSIHAIATFKALDDYLRPRISISERPRGVRSRDGISSAMAAYAAAMTGRDRPGPPPPPALPSVGSSLPTRSTPKTTPRKKESKSKTAVQVDPATPEGEAATRLRRSTRGQSGQTPSTVFPATPAVPTEPMEPTEPTEPMEPTEHDDDLQEGLECADEAQIEDEDDDDDIEADLDALVDDLEEGGLDQDIADPSAVNMEVANTGKVTARTEDGTRVSTPSQTTLTPSQRERLSAASRLAVAREMLSAPSSSARMSYASALQAPPQDWHIEFSINGQPITSETTIYRACHFNQAQADDVSGRTMWSATHSISFKRVPGPAPTERTSPTPTRLATKDHEMPPSLDKHPVTSGILRLMSILHDLNSNLDVVLNEKKSSSTLKPEPLTQFVNTKLTAKLNRQLEEPLVVASQCLPSWAEDLASFYPFLFPFETRHLFLQSTSFGYARSMTRWQNAQENDSSRHRHRDERPFLGRLQRQKVRISRARILESAIKVMELYGGSQSILEVEYFEEVGTGLGPTLEFYSTVSKELSKKKIKLWRENESAESDEYAFGRRGLFPAPMSEETSKNENGQRVLALFKTLGKFVARSMMDSRIIDVSFNPTFFRLGDGTATTLSAVFAVDMDLAKSLKMLKRYATAKAHIDNNDRLSSQQKVRRSEEIIVNGARVEDLSLDFTLPGYPHIELLPSGSSINVTIDNVGDYIDKVVDFTLCAGVQKQVEAFRAGFTQVFPYTALKAFTPDELVMLFGRVEEDWSLETLMDSIKADHGYNLDSKSVRNLLQTMSELPPASKRDFLQFVTGSPKLPIGGKIMSETWC